MEVPRWRREPNTPPPAALNMTSQTVISALVLALVLDLDLHLPSLAVLQDGGVATRFDVHDLVAFVRAFHAGADVLAVVTLAGGTLDHVGDATDAVTTGG